jgi:hypothetical protein
MAAPKHNNQPDRRIAMNSYRIDIETFASGRRANGEIEVADAAMTSVQVTGYRNAVKLAKEEAAKGKLGRCVIMRGPLPQMTGRKF